MKGNSRLQCGFKTIRKKYKAIRQKRLKAISILFFTLGLLLAIVISEYESSIIQHRKTEYVTKEWVIQDGTVTNFEYNVTEGGHISLGLFNTKCDKKNVWTVNYTVKESGRHILRGRTEACQGEHWEVVNPFFPFLSRKMEGDDVVTYRYLSSFEANPGNYTIILQFSGPKDTNITTYAEIATGMDNYCKISPGIFMVITFGGLVAGIIFYLLALDRELKGI